MRDVCARVRVRMRDVVRARVRMRDVVFGLVVRAELHMFFRLVVAWGEDSSAEMLRFTFHHKKCDVFCFFFFAVSLYAVDWMFSCC